MSSCPLSPPPQLWMRLSGALQKKRTSEISYREIIKNSSNDDTTAAKQVAGRAVQAGARFLPCPFPQHPLSLSVLSDWLTLSSGPDLASPCVR